MVRDGKASPSADLAPKSSRRIEEDNDYYRIREYAYMESLIYYFSEEWFDVDSDKRLNIANGMRNMKTGIMPYRCPKCKVAWMSGEYDSKVVDVLPKSVWHNMRMEEKVCSNCDA
jgi:hypothetical protein|tara:strand:- start:5102 stop:5446 length:345 start_codon:yes stop_codon:yes gene_type:complete